MGSCFHGNCEMVSSQAELLAEGEEGTIYHSLYKSFTEISVVDRNDATNAIQKTLKKKIMGAKPWFVIGTKIKADYIKAGDHKISSKINGW